MIEMRECELFLGNLSVFEQLSGREKTGKLGCSKNYAKTQKSSCVFKDVRVLLLKQPNTPNETCTSFLEAFLQQNGYPAYTTSVGWMGYSDEKIVNLCRQELKEGWTR